MICNIEGDSILGTAVLVVEEVDPETGEGNGEWPEPFGVTTDSEGTQRRFLAMHPNDFIDVFNKVFLKESENGSGVAFTVIIGPVGELEGGWNETED